MSYLTQDQLSEIRDMAISYGDADSRIANYCEQQGISFDELDLDEVLLNENVEKCVDCDTYFESCMLTMMDDGPHCDDCMQ